VGAHLGSGIGERGGRIWPLREAMEEANGRVRSPKYVDVGKGRGRWQPWSVAAEERVEEGRAKLTDGGAAVKMGRPVWVAGFIRSRDGSSRAHIYLSDNCKISSFLIMILKIVHS
jgi:hypothetical protein